MPPHVAFRLLGPWELSVEGQALPKPSTQKAQSLLAYLVVHGESAHPREKLAALFWPDADDDRGQRSLRTALWSLRRVLDGGHPSLAEALRASRFDVRWSPGTPVDLDIRRFEALARRALSSGAQPHDALQELQAAADLYRGPLLEGFYDDWCLNERYRLEERFLAVLERLVAMLERAGCLQEAVAGARRLLAIDPLREEMHRAIIRMVGRLGDRGGATRQYQTCKEILRDELNVAPSGETEATYAAARAAQPSPPSDPQPGDTLRGPTAAVPGGSIGPAAQTEARNEPAPRPLPGQPRSDGPPLLARQPEWTALTGWLVQAEAGQGHAALIAGEAGSGKTRVLQEIADRARWRSMRVLWGRCYEYERLLPYQPFAEALRNGLQGGRITAVGGEIQHPAAIDPAALSALPPIWQQALLLLLPEWAGRIEPPPAEHLFRPGEEQAQLLEGISQLLTAAATHRPLLLVIDDLHWAAESTLQLFHHLARLTRQHPILLLGSYRPEELPHAPDGGLVAPAPPLLRMQRSLQAEQALDLLVLQPLDRLQVADLIGHLSGWEAIAGRAGTPAVRPAWIEDLAGALHRYTSGNPLYLLAALDTLQQSGAFADETIAGTERTRWILHRNSTVLVRRLDSPALPGDGALPLPPQLRDLLGERLQRLDPAAREAARLAAVAGREIDLAVLERAWGKGEEEVLRAVDVLLAARFLKEGIGHGARDLAFTSHVLQEAIYDGLPRAARRRAHRRVAEVMEAAYGARASPAELALHFQRGGAPARALPYARAAGRGAEASFANEEAIDHYNLALSLLEQATSSTPMGMEEAAERFELLAARAALQQRLGRLQEEEQDVGLLLSVARALRDPQREASALLRRASLERRTGQYATMEATARGALVLARAHGSQALETRALGALGQAHLERGRYPEALAGYQAALALLRREGDGGNDQAQEAALLDEIGEVYELTGDYPAARRCHEQALALCQAAGDLAGEASTLINLGNVCWFVNDLTGAQGYYEAAIALQRRIGDRRGEGTCLANLGLVLWRRGDLEQALISQRRALAIFESVGDPARIGDCLRAIADVEYLTGLLPQALAGYQRSLDLARGAGSAQGTAQSLYGGARVLRILGDPLAALARVEEARGLCEISGYRHGLAWCDREAGLAELDLGHAAVAHQRLEAAVAAFTALGEPSLLAATRADLACAALALGDLQGALTLAEQAAGALAKDDHGLDQPQAILLALSHVRAAAGDRAGAQEALARAGAEVRAQAERVASVALRTSFLQAVPLNRAIVRAGGAGLPP